MPLKKTFKDLVDDAKSRITEITAAELTQRLAAGQDDLVIIDVREPDDYRSSHIAGAISITRGRLELEIEDAFPNSGEEIVVYCGGGSCGALSADTLQTMGYANVRSLAGGFRGWAGEPSRPVESGE